MNPAIENDPGYAAARTRARDRRGAIIALARSFAAGHLLTSEEMAVAVKAYDDARAVAAAEWARADRERRAAKTPVVPGG